MARREACDRCKRPPRVCYCASLPASPLVTTSHVLVLQHEHEKKKRAAISSVPVLAQTLEQVTVVTVDDCDCSPGANAELDALLYNGDSFDTAMVLFPDEHAQTLSPPTDQVERRAKRVLLIVIDGTWKEAKKIARRNRQHWEKAAKDWEARGARLEYVCLDSEEAKRSIYGDLRREPMEGCMSTLEAVASALAILEPKETGLVAYDALVHAFRGMVSIQEQFQKRGQAAKFEQYGGISKAEAIEAKRLDQQRQKTGGSADTDKSTLVQREYVFYTTHTDFRHRQQLTQQGEVVTCTYNEAREHCAEFNRDRKRGQRVTMLPFDSFEKHLRQCHDA